MTFIKTSLLSSIYTVIRLMNGFVLNKLIAIYVGPSGLAFIIQFQHFMVLVTGFTSSIVGNGVVKYTAECNNIDQKKIIWSTAFKISTLFTLLVSVIIIFFYQRISLWLFKSDEYDHIVIIFALGLILFVWNILLMSILHGQKEIKKYIMINIATSFINLLLIGTLAYLYSLHGALIAFAISQAMVFFISFSIVMKLNWFKFSYLFEKAEKQIALKLGSFFLMASVSAITIPIASMIVRNYLGETVSWDDAGLWDATKKLSNVIVIIMTSGLALYYLPKLSEIQNNTELRKEVFYIFSIVMPLSIIMALIIFFFRDTLILLLYTEDFLNMRSLFVYQLTGDVLFIAAKLLEFVLIAKAMTKEFIVLNISFSITFALLSLKLINDMGTEGVTIAYAINQLGYFLVLTLLFSVKYKKGIKI